MRGVLLLLAVAIATVTFLAPASADEEADRVEAGREFAAGQAADRKKDWPTAIQHYVRANDLAPHPNAMFNIATDYERLGNLRQAAVWYQRYIEAAPDAPDHDKVMRLVRDLATRPTTLTVRTVPDGARLLVDNSFVGTSPYSGKITGGPHRLTFEHEGRREHRDINVEFGEPAIVDLTLRGEVGTLRVVGPPGATLIVDDMPAGSTPGSLELAPGTHRIRVVQDGKAPYETTAEIYPNRESVVNAQMARQESGRTIRAGYLLGFGAGADVKGAGAVALVDLGVQALRYDAAVRIGKAGGVSSIDFVVRWAIGNARIAPYVGLGYAIAIAESDSPSSSSESQRGYALIGGLRVELTRGEHALLALVAESGVRFFPSGTSTDSNSSAVVVPLMASLQVVYK